MMLQRVLLSLSMALLAGCLSSSGSSSGSTQPPEPQQNITNPVYAVQPSSLELSSALSSLQLANDQVSQLTATGVYDLGQRQPLNAAVTWSSSAPELLSVDNSGQIRGLSPGQDIEVTATLNTASATLADSLTFTVTDATLVSLQLEQDLEGQTLSLSQGQSYSFRAIATFTDGPRDVTRDTLWQSSNEDQVLVGNRNSRAGEAFAIGPGEQVNLAGSYGGHTINTLIDVLPDPEKTAFIELTLVPDVILNNGEDTATLTARPFPFGPDADLPVATGFTFTLPSGAAQLQPAQAATSTLNGTVQTVIRSQQAGLSQIQVDADDSFARGNQGLLVVDNFNRIIRTLVVPDTATDPFRYLLALYNPSNREFLITRFQLFDNQSQQLLQDVHLGTDKRLQGKSDVIFPVNLNGPLPTQGVRNRISLREPVSDVEFIVERVIEH